MILEDHIKAGKLTPADKTALKLEIGRIPEALLDNTDRNRTSPFAFTGNKFELKSSRIICKLCSSYDCS